MAIKQATSGKPPKKGGILKALLASPLVGSGIDLSRAREEERRLDIWRAASTARGMTASLSITIAMVAAFEPVSRPADEEG
jgi:hypothetical protein